MSTRERREPKALAGLANWIEEMERERVATLLVQAGLVLTSDRSKNALGISSATVTATVEDGAHVVAIVAQGDTFDGALLGVLRELKALRSSEASECTDDETPE